MQAWGIISLETVEVRSTGNEIGDDLGAGGLFVHGVMVKDVSKSCCVASA